MNDEEMTTHQEKNIPKDNNDFNTRPERKKRDLYVYYSSDDEPVEDSGAMIGDDTDMPEIEAPAFAEESEAGQKSVPKPLHNDRAGENDDAGKSSEPEDHSEEDESDISELHILSVKVNKIFAVNTAISMLTLCAVAALIFSGYAYLRSLEHYMQINLKKMTEIEDSIEALSPDEEEKDEEIIEAANILNERDDEAQAQLSEADIDIEKGKLLIYENSVGYSWVPILTGVKPNNYLRSSFSFDERDRMLYKDGNEISSYFGIDVSAYQGDIDWNAAREDGVEFAMLRIGVRGYAEDGILKADEMFAKNFDEARDAGIDLGVYFYSQAVSAEEAEEEARFVLQLLDGRTLEYPVVFDWENVDTGSTDIIPRTEDVMPQTLTLSAISFCETVKEAGYDTMIYTNKKLAYLKYDMRQLQNYPIWLALYSKELTYYYDFDIWQYGTGTVEGIDGEVDYNIAIIK